MWKNCKLRAHQTRGWLILFRRSLIYQTAEFFKNSTLHGVRYIAESGRPIGEKLMWFCFTSVGAVIAFIIIMSLWEKFQTNPTITGLDTDFHNQNIVFPTVVVCPENPFDHQAAIANSTKITDYKPNLTDLAVKFLEALASLCYENMLTVHELGEQIPDTVNNDTLRMLAFYSPIKCSALFAHCEYRDEHMDCCDEFDLLYTEHGFCYSYNSRFRSIEISDIKAGSPHILYETDQKWSLFFEPKVNSKVFILPYEEHFGMEYTAKILWETDNFVDVRVSKKSTFTTDDARQLTIKQRRCIFHNEVKLQYFPEDYTFSSCMKECRLKKAMQFCKCNPPFYKPSHHLPMCHKAQLPCLHRYRHNITDETTCGHCELSCSNTVFTIEKFTKSKADPTNPEKGGGVSIEFLTWPIIRYKREVLFGWVDLLVSFGGIASLFLGFSLLSGIEIIYYFTLRASCMVYKNKQLLHDIEEEKQRQPPPLVDVSMKILVNKRSRNLDNSNDSRIDVVPTKISSSESAHDKLAISLAARERRRRGDPTKIITDSPDYSHLEYLP